MIITNITQGTGKYDADILRNEETEMIGDLLLVAIGIILGWFFLPTPEVVRELIAKIPVVGSYMKK